MFFVSKLFFIFMVVFILEVTSFFRLASFLRSHKGMQPQSSTTNGHTPAAREISNYYMMYRFPVGNYDIKFHNTIRFMKANKSVPRVDIRILL